MPGNVNAKRVTLRDVAERAGVSINTASRALANKSEISPETKRKVLAAAHALGYRPNRIARALRSQKTRTIGVIVGDIANPYFSALVRGAEKVSRSYEYTVILQGTDEDGDRERKAVETVLATQVDGVLITPTQRDKAPVKMLLESGTPFILMSRYFRDLETSYVVMDDRRGGFLATERLIQKGYHRIAILGGPMHISSAYERYMGYLEAHKAYGLNIDEDLVITGCLTMDDGHRALLGLFRQPKRPQAVFTFSDFVALGVYRAAYESGISIPQDLAVVGFDNTRLGICLNPPLTSVGKNPEELGKRAAFALLKLIHGKFSPPIKMKLGVYLEERKSA
ncbi:MAG: LacI family DNA-binding transcriptional regulator [Nanopusillaceae archaeon]